MANWGKIYCNSWWGDDSNKNSLPTSQFDQCGGGVPYKFTSKNELQTAVNLWISDNAFAVSTYGQINTWNVSAITNMSLIFNGKTDFNDDISNWDVSNVTNMDSMFRFATSFNQNIGNWNVSNVIFMNTMFDNASSFSQDIGTWNVSSLLQTTNIFRNATSFSIGNYDALLNGWATITTLESNITFSTPTLQYSSAGQTARGVLTSAPNNWIIIDGGIN